MTEDAGRILAADLLDDADRAVEGHLAQALEPHRRLARQAIAIALGLDERRPQLGDACPKRARHDPIGL